MFYEILISFPYKTCGGKQCPEIVEIVEPGTSLETVLPEITLTGQLQLAVLPDGSWKVYVTVVVPTLKKSPEL